MNIPRPCPVVIQHPPKMVDHSVDSGGLVAFRGSLATADQRQASLIFIYFKGVAGPGFKTWWCGWIKVLIFNFLQRMFRGALELAAVIVSTVP